MPHHGPAVLTHMTLSSSRWKSILKLYERGTPCGRAHRARHTAANVHSLDGYTCQGTPSLMDGPEPKASQPNGSAPERELSEIETSERALFKTSAAQRGSAVACDESILPPPVSARESSVLRYPRCDQRTSSQRITVQCTLQFTAKVNVRSNKPPKTPPTVPTSPTGHP